MDHRVGYSRFVRNAADAPAIGQYLSTLRRRAAWFAAVRAAAASLGAASGLLAVGAWVLGPLASLGAVLCVWAAAATVAALVVGVAIRPLFALRGAGASSLLHSVAPSLVSPARSAMEFSRGVVGDGASTSLVRAHVLGVEARLARVPPSRVVSTAWLKHPTVSAGSLACVIAAALVAFVDRASAGAWALVHPDARTAAGAPVASVFTDASVRLEFPTYLHRAPEVHAAGTRLEVPLGTSVELHGRVPLDARQVRLLLGQGEVALRRDGEGWMGRFLARADGPLRVEVRIADGPWVSDATTRALRVILDEGPRVTLVSPDDDRILEPDALLDLTFDVQDDVGIAAVEVVVRGPDGAEHRSPVEPVTEGQRTVTGMHTLTLQDVGARPGDRIEVRVEARDGDDVSGPHVGRSATRTITIASESTRRAQAIASAEALLGRALDALADRLETTPPDAEAEAARRLERVKPSQDALLEGLETEARSTDGAGRAPDLVLLREAARRLRRLATDELRLHGASSAPAPRRREADTRVVRELEADVQLVEDLWARARRLDAGAIARELEGLRREIAGLLAELRRADTPEGRAATMASIGRAQQRLAELTEALSRMGTAVPPEFANAETREVEAASDGLQSMRDALERGDLDAAQRQLTRLEQQIDGLVRALGATEDAASDARFGARDRAFAEAVDQLMGLEAEQRELARRTFEVRRAVAERALEQTRAGAAAAAGRLRGRTQEAAHALDGIDEGALSSREQESVAAIRQRILDADVALRSGDLGEAFRMADAASTPLDELVRDLQLDAMMFPGHTGATARNARATAEATRRVRALRDGIDAVLPDLRHHLDAAERSQIVADAPRQRAANAGTARLEAAFEGPPDGEALLPEAADALRAVRRQMDEAARALDRGDPAAAASTQDEAARGLTALREQIEQDSERAAGGGGGGEAGGGGQRSEGGPVRIRAAGDHEGATELRRRLLDAMQRDTPAGFEASVQRYYEGLLR